MKLKSLRRNFWIYLHSQGFPQSINDEILHLACLEIESQACRGKRLSLKDWSFGWSGLHSDDIALILLLAEELGLKQGIDWDWGLESDRYHFEAVYMDGDGVKKLLKLLDFYYSESLIFMNVALRLVSTGGYLSNFESEKLFFEERTKFEELRHLLKEETLNKLLKEIGGEKL